MKVPFNKPHIFGQELVNIATAVLTNSELAGDGQFTRKCHQWLQSTLGCRKGLLTHSCTAALEMAAILMDAKPGNEVIMPSFTFVSTANAFVLRGAVPVFVDIRPDTLNIDETLVELAVTEKTRAIVPVHYAGVPCAMRSINAVAERHGLVVIEDAAQALLSHDEDGFLGVRGHMGCLSFHETKNIISGEGGALLLNDDAYAERAEIIWQKGTNRKKFERGEVDKYSWVDIGSSFLPSELTAAFLFAQMENARQIIKRRQTLAADYAARLDPLLERGLVTLGQTEVGNGHIFSVLAQDVEARNSLLAFLRGRGAYAVSHYVPLHSAPAAERYSRTASPMPVTDSISARLLRLPLYFDMTEGEQDHVVDSLFAFFGVSRT
jgi:dTDP-4-amino-4,6-dideoxygalactose transaminase